MKVKWEEMLADEFETAIEKFPVCYLPLGTLERHGSHLPFGLDSLKAYHICLRVAEKYGGIISPPIYWGTHGFWADDYKRAEKFPLGRKQPPGSVYISEGLLFNYMMEVFRELDYSGFKVVVAFTGHYPVCQVKVIKRAAEQYMEESEMKIWAFYEVELSGEVELEDNHAGRGETALMMELRPDLVDMSKAVPKDAASFPYCQKRLHEATKEYGEAAVNYLVKCIGEKVKELLCGEN